MIAIARTAAILVCLAGLLCACDSIDIDLRGGATSNSSDWLKAGAEPGITQQAYRDCTDIADSATQKDRDIDQDIAATRGADIQRAWAVQARTAEMSDKTRRSAESIIASCMEQKGFYRRR